MLITKLSRLFTLNTYTFSHTSHISVGWFKKRFGSECSIFQIMCSIFQILCICNLIRFLLCSSVYKNEHISVPHILLIHDFRISTLLSYVLLTSEGFIHVYTCDWTSLVAQMVKCLQCRRPRFDPWVGKIPRRRKWQPTPVLLPGESHEQRSLVGYSPWGHKEPDTTRGFTFIHVTGALAHCSSGQACWNES